MYVIEPEIGRTHLYWQDSSGEIQHNVLEGSSGIVDVLRFPGLDAISEVVLILPTGLDILTGVQSRLDAHILDLLAECARRLPDYNQTAYEIAHQLVSNFPNFPVRVICNSAFFSDLPIRERTYALDTRLYKSTYQRFGGDGLAHFGAVKSISAQFSGDQKMISIHLCNQPSVTAWLDHTVVYASMGYSPLEGLISADGCGSIDPGIPLMLADSGKSPAEISRLLVQNSGWNALIEHRVDVDELFSPGRPEYSIARDILLGQIMEQIGAACSALGGVDTITFTVDSLTGSNPLIHAVTSRLGWLGCKPLSTPVTVDDLLIMSKEGSSIRVLALEYSPVEIISSFL